MRNLSKRAISPAAAALLVLGLWSCRPSPKSGLLRLTEVLDKGDVLQSPLTHLDKAFAPITQNVSADEVRSLSHDGHDYWVFATSGPVLALPSEQTPERASLRQNEVEWRYSETPLQSYPTWRWLRGEKWVEFPAAKRSADHPEWISLARGQAVETSLLLPPGEALFELSGRSGDPQSFRSRLTVTVNGRSRDFSLRPEGVIQFVERVPWGQTTVKIANAGSAPLPGKSVRPGQDEALIRSVHVRAASDFVFLTAPRGQKTPSGTYEFSFVPEPADRLFSLNKALIPGQALQETLAFGAAGMGTLEFIGRSASAPGLIRLWLDSRPIEAQEVPEDGFFSRAVPVTAAAGQHELKAVFEPAPPAASRPVPGAGGVVLDSIVWHNPQDSFELPLHLLAKSDLRDAGTGSNPGGIKKKLRVRGASWNALLAPVASLYRFRVSVPGRGVMRLGYGLLPDADWADGVGAHFEVSVDSGGQKKTLFSAGLDPFRKPGDRGVFFADIDLAAYGGKRVSLYLLTHGARSRRSAGSELEDRRNGLAFWVNPLVFSETGAAQPERTNVILISLDAARADHIGCYGYDRDTTPSLDGLAKDSALFLNTISQAPYTLASHISMLTGVYPMTHRVFHFTDTLDPALWTLANRLREGGWATAGFTGGGLMDAQYGYAQGFDEYHDRIISQETTDVSGPLWRRVAAWLKRNKDLNFFLFLHTYQLHSPYRAPAPYGTMFLDKDAKWERRSLEDFIGAGWVHKYAPLDEAQRRNVVALYDGAIRFADETLVKPLLDELKRLNLYDRTMLIITSDHGEEFFDHLTWGHSNTLYNELLKVPLVIKFPGERFRGSRLSPNVRLVDIVPTVLEELRVKAGDGRMDGESLLPILDHRESKERLCPSYLPDNIFADPMPSKMSIIQGRYKFILNEKFPARAYSYFSPPPPDVPPIELFDLSQDPLERKNLANEKGEITRRMLAQAQAFLQAAQRVGEGRKAQMDRELEERLRALGYIK